VIGALVRHHLRWLSSARTVLATALLAAGAVALAGSLALHDASEPALAGAAIAWLVATVGGLLAGGRIVAAERDTGGLRGVLLAPVERREVFLSRAITLALVVAATLALGLALVAVLVAPPGARDPRLGLVLVAAGLGLGPIGALAGMASLSTSVGELLTTGLALPIAAPLLVGGLHATERLLAGQAGWQASLTFATGYALMVAALAYIVSEPVTEVA
jgi:ABC-type transport system involved in cytochrome c biogenesis permease component